MPQNFFEFTPFLFSGAVGRFWFPILFTAFYIFAFLSEIYRIKRDTAAIRRTSLGPLLAGLLLQAAWILGGLLYGDSQAALGAGLWFFVLALGLVLLNLFLFFSYPKTPFAVFLLPAVFVAIAAGSALTSTRFPETKIFLGVVHGISLLTASIFLLFGFVTGVMFFLQRAKIKSRTGFLREIPLPSLEWLLGANRHAVRLSLVFLGLGILFGMVLRETSPLGNRSSSGDMMTWGGIFLFLLMAVTLAVVSRSDQCRKDARLAVLNIVCFLILIFILGYGSLDSRAHWLFPSNGTNTLSVESPTEEEPAP